MKLPPPRATVAVAGVTAACWAIVAASGLDMAVAVRGGFIPARWSGLALTGAVPAWATPLSALLVHGGIIHLGFNLLMLGYCGRFVEAALGARGLLILYVVGAYCAAAAEWIAGPSGMVPMIGASGAISAIVAAYALLYGERRAGMGPPWLAQTLHVAWLAAAWIGLQLLVRLATMNTDQPIAIVAHIGGFMAGLVLARPLLRWGFTARVTTIR